MAEESKSEINTIVVTTTTTIITHKPRLIAKSVSSSLIIIGIIAELLALILITFEHQDKLALSEQLASFNMFMLCLLIASLLFHHYFIMANFKKIDSSTEDELKKMGFGEWVCGRNFEDYLRFPIFILFATLTGEIPYIFAVGMKVKAHVTHSDELFNLEWLTKIFVTASFALALIMFFWNIYGFIYDRIKSKKLLKNQDEIQDAKEKNHKIESKNQDVKLKLPINPFPFKNAVTTFMISDILALVVWTCIFLMFICEKWYLNDVLKYVAFFYIATIMSRIAGAFYQWAEPRFDKLKLLYYSKFPKKTV